MKASEPPSSRTDLLEVAASGGGDGDAGGVAAGEGDGGDARVGDDGVHGGAWHEQGAEGAFGEAAGADDGLDLERAAGDVGGVLEDGGVARHEGRRGEAEDLPVGEVPRHDGEDDAERLVGDVAGGGVGDDRLVGEEVFGVLGVEVAVPGAFLDFGLALGDGLAHFEGGDAREVGFALAEGARDSVEGGGTLGEGGETPVGEGGAGLAERGVYLGRAVGLEGVDDVAGGGVDGLE